jgi:hypothetical protein
LFQGKPQPQLQPNKPQKRAQNAATAKNATQQKQMYTKNPQQQPNKKQQTNKTNPAHSAKMPVLLPSD